MMLANDELRTVLVTIHTSLRRAIEAITFDAVLETIRIAAAAARRFTAGEPRVAVAGLNPHAGEGGLFGDEELLVIAPAVQAARAEGIDASGPFAPDTVFMRARHAAGHPGEFDVVVAMTHDHGLIPVKYLGVEHGVNVTLGLPFVRTSPDHGTAFDIAGSGRADPASFAAAVRMARTLAGGPARAGELTLAGRAGEPALVARRRSQLGELLSRPHRRPLHEVGALDGAEAPGLAHAREHARGHRDRFLVLAAAREDEEAAPRADVRELDLLPLVLQVHLVGEAELDVIDQLRPARRLARLAGLRRRRPELLHGRRVELGDDRRRRQRRRLGRLAEVDVDAVDALAADRLGPVDRRLVDEADLLAPPRA